MLSSECLPRAGGVAVVGGSRCSPSADRNLPLLEEIIPQAPTGVKHKFSTNNRICVGIAQAQIQQPADQMLFMDMADTFVITSTNTYANCVGQLGNGLARHNEGANIAYCDGHVKWMKGDKVRSVIPSTAGTWSDFLGIYMQ